MILPDYNSPSSLRSFIEEKGLAMQKKFGQNFMINEAARKHIIDLLNIAKNDTVWEVGPGLGCMTREALLRGASLTSFEIDYGFIAVLKELFAAEIRANEFSLAEGDVLKLWENYIPISGSKTILPVKLFGNLPYNIAATFIADTILKGVVFSSCVFTVQKEVAERMAASAGTKNYSAFSVLCQSRYAVKLESVLSPCSFWPRPDVSSQVVVFLPLAQDALTAMPKSFTKVVHTLFSSRRKTVLNNMRQIFPNALIAESVLQKAKIPKTQRAENLSVQDFIRLSQCCDCAIVEYNEADNKTQS